MRAVFNGSYENVKHLLMVKATTQTKYTNNIALKYVDARIFVNQNTHCNHPDKTTQPLPVSLLF